VDEEKCEFSLMTTIEAIAQSAHHKSKMPFEEKGVWRVLLLSEITCARFQKRFSG
jgi:hypothetical protein